MGKLGARLYPREVLSWPFDGQPYYRLRGGSYERHETVDPFPCYAHDYNLTDEMLRHVAKAAPLPGMDVTIHILSSEITGRTNGHASYDEYHGELADEAHTRGVKYAGTIVFSGKRIPPMPSMTKYLVAHEYGHLVEGWLDRDGKRGDTRKMYAELREIQPSEDYGGGTWHKGVGELLANDFRLLVCRVETSHWPHGDIARPETLIAVQNYWKIVAAQLVAENKLLQAQEAA